MSDEQQAVVEEADEQAAPASEANGAQEEDDLDTLLSQYEDESGESESEPEGKGEADSGEKDEVLKAHEEIKQWRAEQAKERFEKDVGKAVEAIRGELDPEIFDDALVRGWLEAQAQYDPRLSAAWSQRSQDPKTFQKVLEKLQGKFQKKFSSLPDKSLSEDREAVTQAVRGASKQAPAAEEIDHSDVRNMSDQEFEQWKSRQMKSGS